ncbi:MAG: LysM peptidoglycan-binding domain-containing protein, partial [Firmicutes bacterium]|nr:LysM peptidoglycan-binding domain-containing protein [Bacillota bacterium]
MYNEQDGVYIGLKGESLYLVARREGLSVKELAALNPEIRSVTEDIDGKVLKMPKKKCPGFLYTVQAGDTFFLLAKRFGTTVEAIQAANPGVDPLNLQIGSQICIPVRKPAPPKCPNGFLYTIQAGDTFFLLAQRFGTTV